MGKLTLITGGVRSGKSSYAEQLAARAGQKVVYIATAQRTDAEMERRIDAHRLKRPSTWQTIEAPIGIGEHFLSQVIQADVILLDCLTVWVSNLVLRACPDLDQPDEAAAYQLVQAEVKALLEIIHTAQIPWIVVTNEVGMGVVPPYPAGRLYRDLLGWANQQLAAAAEQVILMIAGIPWRLFPAER
jgi:adenosylcobinamide kinase/adenosylcobinamide-phosphate guanylyltransferase